MKNTARALMALLLVLFLAFTLGCGSEGSGGKDDGGGGEPPAVEASSVTVATTQTEGKVANGTDFYTITAQALDSANVPLAGAEVQFSVSVSGNSGLVTLSPPSGTTDQNGNITCEVTDISTTDDSVVITASSGSARSGEITLSFRGSATAVASVTLAAPETAGKTANGSDAYTVTAQVKDVDGVPLPNTAVQFTVSGNSGQVTLTPPSGTTDESGNISTDVTEISETNDNVDVTASSEGIDSSPLTLTFVGTAGGTTPVPDNISIGASQITVKSDNSETIVITATVLDENNAVVPGINVDFTATAGQLSTNATATDASGEAKVNFSSGTTNKSNRVATVSATVTVFGQSTQIPIQIQGSTATVVSTRTQLSVGGDRAAVQITARDAGAVPVFDATVTLDLLPPSDPAEQLGQVTIWATDPNTESLVQYDPDNPPFTLKTNVVGELAVQLEGVSDGKVVLEVQTLGDTKTEEFTVTSPVETFQIIDPADALVSMSTGQQLNVTVQAPTQNLVIFATTLGSWVPVEGEGANQMVVTRPVSNGIVSAVLETLSETGMATVQTSDAESSGTTDSLAVAISAPSSEATQVALQATATVVAPSTGDITNTVTLIATVKNATDQPVGNAPVSFSLQNPTGGGEFLFPTIVFTDDRGIAQTTFSSGSLASDSQGVTVQANVLVANPVVPSTVTIIIGGTAGSVVIGEGTTVEVMNDETALRLPLSVVVSDSNGNPIPNATVSLNVWPVNYYTGYFNQFLITQPDGTTGTDWCAWISYACPNEDDPGRNLILDPGEDCNGDDGLTPGLSAAGTLPASVTTDENGVGTFSLVYLKVHAWWIRDQIKATTLVLGTEMTGTYNVTLPILDVDYDEGNFDSIFGSGGIPSAPFPPCAACDFLGQFVCAN